MIQKCTYHEYQPIRYVCINQDCVQNKLICYFCKNQKHKKHYTITFKQLKQKIYKSQENNISIKNVSLIDNKLLLIQRQIMKVRKYLQNYQLIIQSYKKFCKRIFQQINTISDKSKYLQIFNTINKDKINQWINQYGQYLIKKQQNQQDTNIIQKIIQQKGNYLTSIIESIQKKKLQQISDNEILVLFNEQKNSPLKLHFSQNLKGSCISIHSPTRASMTGSGSQRMILLEPALCRTRSIKKWKIKIQKFASWIGVGVAHYTSIVNANFEFLYTSTGHGNYLISSNGYSWNGFKPQFNSKYETFQFKTNDIIQLTYNPNDNTISFQKQGEQKIHKYDIDPNQKPIHAAVNLTGIGDAVQIIH